MIRITIKLAYFKLLLNIQTKKKVFTIDTLVDIASCIGHRFTASHSHKQTSVAPPFLTKGHQHVGVSSF